MNIKGIFRPNLAVMNPKNIFPMRPPKQMSEAIQLACSIVIFPDGNGESFDVSKAMLGLAHPHVTP